jgi:hypothetical protein
MRFAICDLGVSVIKFEGEQGTQYVVDSFKEDTR